MTATDLRVVEADPTHPPVRRLVDAHLAHSWAATPQTSNHTMTPEAMVEASLRFWALFDGDEALACGALKPLGDGLVEVKSVHVLESARGRGLSRRMMDHLIKVARGEGYAAMVLETGSELLPEYDAARALYERMWFSYRGPIPGYGPDENSAFMERRL